MNRDLDLDKTAWQRVAFGDVVRNVNESIRDPRAEGFDRFIGLEHMEVKELRIERWGTAEDGATFTRRVRPGQTLFGKRRAYQRKVAFAEHDGVCSGDILTFQADEVRLLPEFLPFIVQSDAFFRHALDTSAGSLSPRTSWSSVSQFEFHLPPIAVQQKIAELLWATQWHSLRLRDMAVALRSTASTMIADVRRSAGSSELRTLASIRNGETFPLSLQGGLTGDVPFFKVGDLDRPGNERWLIKAENQITSEQMSQLRTSPFPIGAIVTVRVGAAIRAERRRMLKSPALVDDNHLIIQPQGSDSTYLWAILNETSLSATRNDGVVPSLNQRIVGSVMIPDISLSQQIAVGKRYLQVHEAADDVDGEVLALRSLREALVEEVFE